MKLRATIPLGNATADFELCKRGPGLYQADLISVEGKPEQTCPSSILLVRNVREWSGSCEDEALIDSLGRYIDQVSKFAPIFNCVESPRKRESNRSPEQ